MLNIYLEQSTLGALNVPESAEAAAPYRDAIIEFTDLPLTGVCTVQEGEIGIEVFYRDEMHTNTRVFRKGTIQTGTGYSADEDQVLFLYAVTLKLACLFLDREGVLDTAVKLDEEKEGVLIEAEGDTASARRVSGKDRPNMVCTTLFGGTELRRPYMDEIIDASLRETMTWEEKIQAAQDGDEDMMEALAIAYLDGSDDVEPDAQKAVYWFRQLSERDNAVAQFNLALHYAKGFGVERDFAQARYWMERSAANGDEDAPAAAQKYAQVEENEHKAKAGDAQAQADLAAFYMAMGGSLRQAGAGDDYAQALHWARLAADAGSGDAMWTLALAYEHGRGVEEDVNEAIAWYRRGAEIGHAPSQHSLGCFLMRGDGLDADEEEGFRLFMAAAQQGYALAMRDLGRCYQFGNGVKDDMHEALVWYDKALETLDDPELERKVAIFHQLEDGGAFEEDYGADEDDDGERMEIDRYLTGIAPDAVSHAWKYEDELDEAGLLPQYPHGEEAWEELPRVHYQAQQGDERAIAILQNLEKLEG